MATSVTETSGSHDIVLEARHLAAIFILVVVLFSGVFTLGYLLGHSQYDTRVHADASTFRPQNPMEGLGTAAGRPFEDARVQPSALDSAFHHAAEPDIPVGQVAPQLKSVSAAKGSLPLESAKPNLPDDSAPGETFKSLSSSTISRGAIVLQVAALLRQADAQALVQVLQQKRFPAFVLTSDTDKFFRVQVGPYSDAPSANIARENLAGQGYKSIIKR